MCVVRFHLALANLAHENNAKTTTLQMQEKEKQTFVD
jgi:hypothetical protein